MFTNLHYFVVNIVLYFYFLPVQAHVAGNYYVADDYNYESNVIRTTFTGENSTGVITASRYNLPYLGLDCNITIIAPRNHGIILRVDNVLLPSENGTCLDYIEISGGTETFENIQLCSSGGLTFNSSTFLIRFHSSNSTSSPSPFRNGYFRIVFTTYNEHFPCSSFRCSNLFCISNDLTCDGVNNCGDNSDESNSLHGANCGKDNSFAANPAMPVKIKPFDFDRFTVPRFEVFTFPTFNFRHLTIPTIKIPKNTNNDFNTVRIGFYLIAIPIVLIIKLVACLCYKKMRRDAARAALENSPESTYPIGPQRYPSSGGTAAHNAALGQVNFQPIQHNHGGVVEAENALIIDQPPPYSQTTTEESPPPYDDKKQVPPYSGNNQGPAEVYVAIPSAESNPQIINPSAPQQSNNVPEVLASQRNPQRTGHPIHSISFPRKT